MSSAAIQDEIPEGAVTHALGWHLPDLSDFMFELAIPGNAIMKKNNYEPRRRGRYLSIGKKDIYQRWESRAVRKLKDQWLDVFARDAFLPAGVELNLAVVSYRENRKSWPDLSATYEGPQDVLEVCKSTCELGCPSHAGIIANDKYVCGHTGSGRLVDAANPRTVLIITPRYPGEARPDPNQQQLIAGATNDPDTTDREHFRRCR